MNRASWIADVFAFAAGLALAGGLGVNATLAAPALESAGDPLGLYDSARYRLATGACGDCPTIRQALWYFRDQSIAVPRDARAMSGFEPGVPAFDDVRKWAASRPADAGLDDAPLIWIGAPDIVHGAKLGADGKALTTPERSFAFRLAEKIPLNRSYYDASSTAFFRERPVTARGVAGADAFTLRTLWPEDFRLGPRASPARAWPTEATAQDLVRMLMREEPKGGAQSPYATMTLWKRPGTGDDWTGRPVIALLVNGAQGDDDESLGGHFAIVTGRVRADGRIGDWLVNNFYSLDVESEKGILAAPVPLDNYLADLNSGQGWYRPSYMIVAVLRDERAAALVQSGLNRVYNQFWRHQLVYYHPTQNCASISVDTLRALGWDVPARGASSRTLAWIVFPFVATIKGSEKAKLAFDYLAADRTRLLPAVALEQGFASLYALGTAGAPREGGRLAQQLAQDLEALAFVRMPQFPSSRAFGDAPVVALSEYRLRIPDPAHPQIVPVPPRPFPPELRDPDLLPPSRHPSDAAPWVWGALAIIGIVLVVWRVSKRMRARR